MSGSNEFLGMILVTLGLSSMATGVAAKAIAPTYHGSNTFNCVVYIWMASHLAGDLITTSVIALFLYRSKTGWSQTDAILTRLLLLTAETQLPPTLISIALLITYVLDPNSTWAVLYLFTTKVFGVCLLAVLNTKYTLRRELETASSNAGNNTYALKSRPKKSSVQVMVQTETYLETDDANSGLGSEIRRKRGHGNELDVEFDGGDSADCEGFKKLADIEEGSLYPLPSVRFERG